MNGSKRNEHSDWQAFCYVAGEMEEAESAEFERRLETDQAAREAVAEAAELVELIWRVETEHVDAELAVAPTSNRSTVRPRRRLLIVAGTLVATAATLMAALCGNFAWTDWFGGPIEHQDSRPVTAGSQTPRAPGPRTSHTEHDDARELAYRWFEASEALMRANLDHITPVGDESRERPLDDLLSDEPADHYADVDPLTTPSWMLAGLAHLSNVESQE